MEYDLISHGGGTKFYTNAHTLTFSYYRGRSFCLSAENLRVYISSSHNPFLLVTSNANQIWCFILETNVRVYNECRC
jgi:hypothetical protein